jgi:HTH-type transcriptional regulator/antitoxin HigA
MEKMSVQVIDPKKYGRLLARALPSVIESEEEHARFLMEIEKLMDEGEARTAEETRLMTLLAHLVQEFEDRNYPIGGSSTPTSILNTLMEQRGLTHKDIWRLFGSKGIASEVINGKRAISKAHARTLSEFFHVPIDLFL